MTDTASAPLAAYLTELSHRCLAAYREHPSLVLEQANIERSIMQGGYSRRQLYELVQNAADAIGANRTGRIEVIRTEDAIYCANEGDPIDADGIEALMTSHMSQKRSTEIGRFGLGFKSVLEICESPQLFSNAVSFGFDSDRAHMQIQTVVPSAIHTPTLRLAWPLDIAIARKSDPTLDELLRWATTVIRLPLSANADEDWLSADMRDFPAEFLLFSSHVHELDLDDRLGGVRRTIRLRRAGDELTLQEGEDVSRWRVFQQLYRPSDAARKNASSINDREEVPVMWAVPLTNRRPQRRKFWAFFPTLDENTISGIVNAPWKTNEDRQNLLQGRFNEELLDVVAEMVAANIGLVNDPADPGYCLSLLPGREDGPGGWAENYLNRRVYEVLSRTKCLPDLDGTLRQATEIHVFPENIHVEALQTWSQSPDLQRNWLHWEADSRERRPRVKRLMDLALAAPDPFDAWLPAAVRKKSPAGSRSAILAAAIIVEKNPLRRSELDRLNIVLTAEGRLVPAVAGFVFLPSDQDAPGLHVVHPELASDPLVARALEQLGIGLVDATSQLTALLKRYDPTKAADIPWDTIWSLVGSLPPTQAVSLMRPQKYTTDSVKVRTLDFSYRPLASLLLPGPIVGVDPQDRSSTIDTNWHQDSLEALKLLGAVDAPVSDFQGSAEPRWYLEYLGAMRDQYLHRLPHNSASPQRDYLVVDETMTIGPIAPLLSLGDEGRVRFTHALLSRVGQDLSWDMYHRSRPDRYPTLELPSPYLWILWKHGRLRTSLGIVPIAQALSPALSEMRDLMPVADCTRREADQLQLPSAFPEITAPQWSAALERIASLPMEQAGTAYARICAFIEAPDRIRCEVDGAAAHRAPADITVTDRPSDLDLLMERQVPYLLLRDPDDAQILIDNWQLQRPPEPAPNRIFYTAVGEEETLETVLPTLSSRLTPEQRGQLLVPAEDIRVERPSDSGREDATRAAALVEGILIWDRNLDVSGLLREVDALLELRLSPADRSAILTSNDASLRIELERDVLRQRAAIAEEPTLAHRLLAAVGPDALQSHLPEPLLRAYRDRYGAPQPLDFSQLALAVFGYGVLREYQDELRTNGLRPPQRWRRNQETSDFVHSIGFPEEYARFDQPRRRPATLEVQGRSPLPSLHPFQIAIRDRIHGLLTSTDGKRGVVSLPTGAGKTRVTVESLIDGYHRKTLSGPVLWVAQSDELCEQAVQTWADVWHAVGPPSNLVISRLWSANGATPVERGHQVVVATIQKLQNRIDDPAYNWLFDHIACLVVDEAHSSTSSVYTALLDRVGLGRSQSRDRTPLIGLTATPFRGNEEESRRLAFRYGETRLDSGILGENPYATLQKMRILSMVDHEVLPGSSIQLNEPELAHLHEFQRLPPTAEERLGRNLDRNNALIDSIASLDESWPVLLFATSVEHAQTMAALLTKEGIVAATISSRTEFGERRRYIDQFRKNQIRVLTNYGVLTTGFDAPSIRALYVARPTYSPVLYQQMIGRGLRGPLNGGKERCLIVNVADNIVQFGEELAFRKFEFLWKT